MLTSDHLACIMNCLQDACSFSGAWRGKPAQMARVYYVSSYFWDRASESGIIADKAAIEWKTSPGVSGALAALFLLLALVDLL
jgi:hypothetical protein